MPQIFYTTYSTDDSVSPEDERTASRADLPRLIRLRLRHNDDFFGIVDDEGSTLQFMKMGGDRVEADVPSPSEGGSYVKRMTIDEAAALAAETEPPYAALKDIFPFRSWDAPIKATPLAIAEADLRPLVDGIGFCFATDMITRADRGIRYCYRDEPDNDIDSGWRFFAGYEGDSYPEESIDLYKVNTIANYDPAIIPLLEAPVGSAFERRDVFRPFERIDR